MLLQTIGAETPQSAICAARHKRISLQEEDTKLQVVPMRYGNVGEPILRGFVCRFSSSRALYHRGGASRSFEVDIVEVSLSRLKSAIRTDGE